MTVSDGSMNDSYIFVKTLSNLEMIYLSKTLQDLYKVINIAFPEKGVRSGQMKDDVERIVKAIARYENCFNFLGRKKKKEKKIKIVVLF